MAKTFIWRNGIPLLLSAIQKYSAANANPPDTKIIWSTLGRAINGKETPLEFVKKDQKLSILKQAIDSSILLLDKSHCDNDNSNNQYTADVLLVVLYPIAITMKDDSLKTEELKTLRIVPMCIRLLKTKNDEWNRNVDVVTYILGILCVCTKRKKLFYDRNLEQLFPSLVHCMWCFSEHIKIRSFVLSLVEITIDSMDNLKMEQTGVLEAASAILQIEGLDNETKETVRGIMRKILS